MPSTQFEAIPGPSDGGFWLLVLLSWLLKALLFAFWIVVVWRALRAHERIPGNLAATLRASVAGEPPSGGVPPRQP